MHRVHRSTGFVLTLAVAAGLAFTGCAEKPKKHEFVHPSHVEHHEGSHEAQITLTQRAHERTGIETAKVGEAPVSKKRTFQGEVVSRGGGLAVRVAAPGNAAAGEAQVYALTRSDARWKAHRVSGSAASGEVRYALDGDSGLVLGQRVGVELALSTTHRKVVPYSSVIYDEHGDTWVYTQPEPLKYVRAPIDIDYIEGDVAVLNDGPPNGTAVVSVGAIELYGTEFEVGH
jgi:hypothetical protein